MAEKVESVPRSLHSLSLPGRLQRVEERKLVREPLGGVLGGFLVVVQRSEPRARTPHGQEPSSELQDPVQRSWTPDSFASLDPFLR